MTQHEKPEFESHKREMINAYLEREVNTRQAARYAMHQAEQAFKLAADQYALSNNVIDDLLADLGDVEQVTPQWEET